jgi:Patatin-like phospholipase
MLCIITVLLFLLSSLHSVSCFSHGLRQNAVMIFQRFLSPRKDECYEPSTDTHLIFPGGGIYFYWQAGAITYLKEQNYDLNSTTMTGASAGALSATLTATNVDFYKATELALQMAVDAGIWDRSRGLQGIWGDLIYEWLNELLPPDAVQRVNHTERLTLLVTPVPSFGKMRVSNFRDREDLLRCNMASVHLPWFLDSKLTATFRDYPAIDGSFLARERDYFHSGTNHSSRNNVVIDYNQDPKYQSQSLLSFINAVSPSVIYKMLEDGKRYAKIMEEKGYFASLRKKANAPHKNEK